MVHGKVEIHYDLEKKVRAFVYTSFTGGVYRGVLNQENNHEFVVEGIGSRNGDDYRTAAGKELHCCGAQGFGQSDDVCPRCEVTNHSFAILKDLTFLLEGGK